MYCAVMYSGESVKKYLSAQVLYFITVKSYELSPDHGNSMLRGEFTIPGTGLKKIKEYDMKKFLSTFSAAFILFTAINPSTVSAHDMSAGLYA